MSYMYVNDFVGTSATRVEVMGEDLEKGSHKAVGYDESGAVVVATSGEEAVGILLSSTPVFLAKGDSVSVIVKDMGLLEAGEKIGKGDFVSINESGLGVVATTGDFIFGRAFTSGEGSGSLIQVEIFPCGAKM